MIELVLPAQKLSSYPPPNALWLERYPDLHQLGTPVFLSNCIAGVGFECPSERGPDSAASGISTAVQKTLGHDAERESRRFHAEAGAYDIQAVLTTGEAAESFYERRGGEIIERLSQLGAAPVYLVAMRGTFHVPCERAACRPSYPVVMFWVPASEIHAGPTGRVLASYPHLNSLGKPISMGSTSR